MSAWVSPLRMPSVTSSVATSAPNAFRDVLSDFTEHWMLFFGPLLVARVLLVKDGIWGMLVRATGADDKLGEPKVDFPEALERAADSKPGAAK